MKKKFVGKVLSAMSAAAIAATSVASLPIANVKASALSGLNAKGIVSQMKIGWNLGNTLDAHNSKVPAGSSPEKYASQWGMPAPNAQQFQAVKEAGFNTVRIPVTWYEHLEQRGNSYHVNDQWMSYVKQTVDYAIDRDMFVILNIHHEDFINVAQFNENTYYQAETKMKSIWSEVAETFANYDQHLIFEGMNEPRQLSNPSVQQWGDGSGDGGYSWNYINRLNETFVRTVRAQGSSQNRERLLMLPGYCASSNYDAINNIAIPSNAGNVALSVHAYAPYYFTMATDSKANHNFPGQSGWGENYESALSDMFGYFGQLQSIKGAPIIIGEFSASDFNNTEDRVRWAKSYLSKAKEKGIPCVLWDNNVIGATDGEAHGYLNRANCTWYSNSKPVIEAMMEVYDINSNTGGEVNSNYIWSKVNIGDNWIELFKSNDGRTIEAWKNFTVAGWNNFANDNYDFVLIYDSANEPELVLQDANYDYWNRVSSSDNSGTPFVKKFTYSDLTSAVAGSGMTVNQMKNLFISATMGELTAYGLYAVPTGTPVPDPQPQYNTYPTNIRVNYNTQYHQIQFVWDAVPNAQNYGIAVYLAGKWRIQTQYIPGSTLSYITPKNLTPGLSYKVAIAAKVNGTWDVNNAIKNAVYVTVR
ncbi:glycoside hydrolase family 5 protein [Ruminococcus albus]|uniref:Aryl-phospho-beta-D-glucosidase BglC, GH1 family n=1 Tax=Ruminococcus albus TaxID=1264 RepID=A0A1I1NLB7_RUMAL|nr:glycoside hydrolase family 5 protein [Ruminococcus albus]SFC96268.1 Aryl-phospho-beta-D-glucosidase BglC, GH1 family [Ruminococcus albus]